MGISMVFLFILFTTDIIKWMHSKFDMPKIKGNIWHCVYIKHLDTKKLWLWHIVTIHYKIPYICRILKQWILAQILLEAALLDKNNWFRHFEKVNKILHLHLLISSYHKALWKKKWIKKMFLSKSLISAYVHLSIPGISIILKRRLKYFIDYHFGSCNNTTMII